MYDAVAAPNSFRGTPPPSNHLERLQDLVALEDNERHDGVMTADQPSICRRRNDVQAAYVNAALVIKQFDLRQAENMLLREGVSHEVIARVLLTGQPLRHVSQSSWAEQFSP